MGKRTTNDGIAQATAVCFRLRDSLTGLSRHNARELVKAKTDCYVSDAAADDALSAAEIQLSKIPRRDKGSYGSGGMATRAVARIVRELVADLIAIGALDDNQKWTELTKQLQAIQGGKSSEIYSPSCESESESVS